MTMSSNSTKVKGYIDVRIPVDGIYHCSDSATPDQIANIVKDVIFSGSNCTKSKLLDFNIEIEKVKQKF